MDFLFALYRFLFKKKRDWSAKYWWKRVKHLLDMLLHVNMMRITYRELKALDVVTDKKLSQITQRMISGNYCGKNFSLSDKLNTVLYHYGAINQRFTNSFLPSEDAWHLIWTNLSKQYRYEIRLAWSDHPTEGELSLLFCVDGLAIYTMSFTLIGANRLGKKHQIQSDGILLTRVQGLKDSQELVHVSSKEHFQSYPTFLLFAALQGFAQALEYKVLVGICADSSLNFDKNQDRYYGAYNSFWEKLGGRRISKSYFELPILLHDLDPTKLTGHHRKRTMNRHAMKSDIIRTTRESVSQYLAK